MKYNMRQSSECLAALNCRNVGPMCFSCRFQDKLKQDNIENIKK